MSKSDRQKKRSLRKGRYAKPSAPRVIGANDNHANDNAPARMVVSGVELTADQTRRFVAAAEGMASNDHDRRVAGSRAMVELEAEIGQVIAARQYQGDIAETLALEEGRGARIETSDRKEHAGRKRIASRDGLETLLTSASITRTQHAAGLRYRADYETLDPEKGLTPPPIDQSRKIVRGGDGFAQKRAERELFIRDLEAMIQDEDPTFRGALGRSDVERIGRAVWALREIAGKGSNLRSLSNSGSVIALTSSALIVALDCAAIAYGLE